MSESTKPTIITEPENLLEKGLRAADSNQETKSTENLEEVVKVQLRSEDKERKILIAFEENFDPINFFNSRFPDQNSLVDLHSVIDDLSFEVQKLDSEILNGIHQHAVLNTKMREEINKGQDMTKTIINEIKVQPVSDSNIREKS